MHKGKAKNRSWSGIPFDPRLYHWDRDQVVHWYWSLHRLGIIQPETFEHVLNIFCLVNKSPSSQLLDLKSEEELQLAHHRHGKLLGHKILKLNIASIVSRPKNNIISIYLAYKQISFYSLGEERGIYQPDLKPLLN